MDAINYAHSAKQAKRIKKFINEPDSSSGVVTVPKVIASGETITIPAGRMAVLPNIQIDGTLNVQGDVFIPSGATMSKVVEKVTSTDNAIVRFNGTTGDVQDSLITINDYGAMVINTNSTSGWALQASNTNITSGHGLYVSTPASGTGIPFRVDASGSANSFLVDKSGNVGIGVTPSATPTSYKTLQIGADGTGLYGWNNSFGMLLATNAKLDGSTWKYSYGGGYGSCMVEIGSSVPGACKWYTAPSGTAGNAITWTNTMTLDASGDLTLGQSIFRRSVTGLLSEGIDVLNLYQPVGYNTRFSIVNGASPNVANAGFFIARNSVTLRSINAGGTINASGADYAEYEYSNDITLVKGQIVGFKSDGTLTDKYSEAIRFAIKSTNPSIVGGDTWGIEEIVGKRPEKPVKSEEMTDEEFAELEELYELELADFEARLEVERQKVDRIAYAGKVPVNVYGAVAGQYVIAVEKDGVIDGKLVNKSDMTFAEYQDAVGRVNKILDDGRAEVAVIIH